MIYCLFYALLVAGLLTGAYAVIGRMAQDHVVLAQYGYGRTDAADGRVWPWVFGATANYWSQIAMKLNFIQQQEGGIEKMKGKTIVHLHIDTAYGREPLPAMRQIAPVSGAKSLITCSLNTLSTP